MASVGLFIIIAMIIIILLIVVSIFATKGAIDIFSSPNYSSDVNLKSAHRNLTIASVMGWISLALLLVIFFTAFALGAFTILDLVNIVGEKANPSKDDILKAIKSESGLSSAHTAGIILLVFMTFIGLIILVSGILCASAAVSISKSVNISQGSVKSGYNSSVIAACISIILVVMIVFAMITYVFIKNTILEQKTEVETLKEKEIIEN